MQDIYIVTAFLMAMALLATLRFCVWGPPQQGAGIVRLLTHPAWLLPIAIAVPYALGSYYKGTISPWPPTAFATFSTADGVWGGLTASLVAATTDLWVLWAAAKAASLFAPPKDKNLVKYYYVVNLAVGLFFILRGVWLARPGA